MKKLNINSDGTGMNRNINKILIPLTLILIIGIVSANQPDNIIWQIGKYDNNHAEFNQNPEGATHYSHGTDFINFPKDLNDGFNERTHVYIHYDLNDKQVKKEMNLQLCITELNSPDKDNSFKFKVNLNDKSIGDYYFTSSNSCKNIKLNKNFNQVGENVILIKNTHPPLTDHWILWDYLDLKVVECPYECCVNDEYYEKICGSDEECKDHKCKIVKNPGDSCSSDSECDSGSCICNTCKYAASPQIDSKVMDASQNNPGTLVVQVSNIINNPDIKGQIILSIPDNVEIHDVRGGSSGKGAYTVTYDAPAGESKYIEIEFNSKTAGDYRFSATHYWHWKCDDSNGKIHQLGIDKTVTIWPVKKCNSKYCDPGEECIENKCIVKNENNEWWQNPLFIIAIALIIVIIIALIRRSKVIIDD